MVSEGKPCSGGPGPRQRRPLNHLDSTLDRGANGIDGLSKRETSSDDLIEQWLHLPNERCALYHPIHMMSITVNIIGLYLSFLRASLGEVLTDGVDCFRVRLPEVPRGCEHYSLAA